MTSCHVIFHQIDRKCGMCMRCIHSDSQCSAQKPVLLLVQPSLSCQKPSTKRTSCLEDRSKHDKCVGTCAFLGSDTANNAQQLRLGCKVITGGVTLITQRCEVIAIPTRPSLPGAYWESLASQTKLSHTQHKTTHCAACSDPAMLQAASCLRH